MCIGRTQTNIQLAKFLTREPVVVKHGGNPLWKLFSIRLILVFIDFIHPVSYDYALQPTDRAVALCLSHQPSIPFS